MEPANQLQLQNRAPLSEGTSLHRRYNIQHAFRCDDATLAYSGFDYVARQPVMVLEFFPVRIASRAKDSVAVSPMDREYGELFFLGMDAFYRQYDKLMQTIGSPNILSVFDAFFENGTAYAVTEQPVGLSLTQYLTLRRRSLNDGELVYIVRALADALLVVHSCNLLHHGISEQTILLCPDGTVKLTDFSEGHTAVRDGHAVRNGEPWNDIHALGETLYRAYFQTRQDIVPMYMDATMPRTLSALFAGMLSDSASQRFTSVFDLRYTADSLDIAPVCPDVTPESIAAYEELSRRAEPSHSIPTEPCRGPEQSDAPKKMRRTGSNMPLAPVIGATILLLLGVLIWVLIRW